MYTTMQVCRKLGMTYQTLKYYCNEGLVPNVSCIFRISSVSIIRCQIQKARHLIFMKKNAAKH